MHSFSGCLALDSAFALHLAKAWNLPEFESVCIFWGAVVKVMTSARSYQLNSDGCRPKEPLGTTNCWRQSKLR
jgi:hypothetical protein